SVWAIGSRSTAYVRHFRLQNNTKTQGALDAVSSITDRTPTSRGCPRIRSRQCQASLQAVAGLPCGERSFSSPKLQPAYWQMKLPSTPLDHTKARRGLSATQ